MILSIILLILNININSEEYNYLIYSNGNFAGYAYISLNESQIFEKYLWKNGFSDEYSENRIKIKPELEIVNEIYYASNKLPMVLKYQDGKLIKRLPDRELTINIKSTCSFLHSNGSPLSTILYFTKIKKNAEIFNTTTLNYEKLKVNGEEIELNGKIGRIYKSAEMPDSVSFANFMFVKNTKPIQIKNPYFINFPNLFTKDDFIKKGHHIIVNIENSEGELSYDKLSDTLVILLPYSISSNLYGNSSSNITPYTNLQLAENIKYPVFIFEFDKTRTIDEIKSEIQKIWKYFNEKFGNIIFISFNELSIPLLKSEVNAKKILVNPPLTGMREFNRHIFDNLSIKNNYTYSKFSNYVNYEAIDSSTEYKDMLKSYNISKGSYFLFSKSILSDSEIKNAGRIKGKIVYIKNIDRRLNSYNIYELWSFEKNPFINEKIFQLMNGMIKKM